MTGHQGWASCPLARELTSGALATILLILSFLIYHEPTFQSLASLISRFNQHFYYLSFRKKAGLAHDWVGQYSFQGVVHRYVTR